MKAGRWGDDATDISLSAIFDPKAMQSSCILRILFKKDLEEFKKRLHDLRLWAWYPLFVPVIFIELRIQELPESVIRIRHFLYRVERTIGTHKNYSRRLGFTTSTARSLHEVWNDPDFEMAPAELTSIASDCVYFGHACLIRHNLLNDISNINKRLLRSKCTLSCDGVGRILEEKMVFMRAWMIQVHYRSEYLGKRAEVQVQTVRSLILAPLIAL